MFALIWIILAIGVGILGNSRSVGFVLPLLFSLFLSPVVGLIIVLFSERLSDIQFKKESLELQRQTAQLNGIIVPRELSLKDSMLLQSLEKALKDGTISHSQFYEAKKKLMEG